MWSALRVLEVVFTRASRWDGEAGHKCFFNDGGVV